MSAGRKTNRLFSFIMATLLLVPNIAFAELKLNMTEGVTSISQQAYGLHMLVLWIVTIVGIAVFAVIIYSLIYHRKSKGAVAAQFHESTTVEVIWTVVPLVVLVLIAIPATKTLLHIEDASNPDITIKVTGWQWKWQYEYLDEGINFFSNLDAKSNEARQRNSGVDVRTVEHYLLDVDNPIVIPVGKKVRFLTTANDVIHSWWVPALGMKRDAIPGYINEFWTRVDEPGVYRGQCAELCGKDHGFMPIVVKAVSDSEYQSWVKGQKLAMAEAAAGVDKTWTKDDLMKRGEQVYNTSCAACHQPTGTGVPGVFPGLVNSKITIGPAADHINIVVNGKAGTAMQAFGAQLNDADLAAVITYERNSWGNAASVVQPADVKAAR
jgi:cytochrome c oxidase subunit 2